MKVQWSNREVQENSENTGKSRGSNGEYSGGIGKYSENTGKYCGGIEKYSGNTGKYREVQCEYRETVEV